MRIISILCLMSTTAFCQLFQEDFEKQAAISAIVQGGKKDANILREDFEFVGQNDDLKMQNLKKRSNGIPLFKAIPPASLRHWISRRSDSITFSNVGEENTIAGKHFSISKRSIRSAANHRKRIRAHSENGSDDFKQAHADFRSRTLPLS